MIEYYRCTILPAEFQWISNMPSSAQLAFLKRTVLKSTMYIVFLNTGFEFLTITQCTVITQGSAWEQHWY